MYDNNRTFTHDIKCFGPGMMLQAGHYKFDLYIISDSYIGLDVTQKVRRLRGHTNVICTPHSHTVRFLAMRDDAAARPRGWIVHLWARVVLCVGTEKLKLELFV